MTESSFKNNRALEILNNKLLDILNDGGTIATYMMSPLSKITNSESSNQFKFLKDSSSSRVNDLLIQNTIPNTLCIILLIFCDTGKKSNWKEIFWKW